MRIAVICTFYGYAGGTGRVTVEVFERFARDGVEVDVYCNVCEEGLRETTLANAIHVLPITRFGLFKPLAMLWKASRTVNKKLYDIIYTTGDYYNKPDIVTVHMLKKEARKITERLEREGVLQRIESPLKTWARKLYGPLIYELGEQLVYRRKDCIYIGVSEGVTHAFTRAFGQQDNPGVLSIANGVDDRAMMRNLDKRAQIRRQYGIEASRKVAVFVGSDWRRKRLDVAIDVLAQVPELMLLVAGYDQPDKYQEMAAQKGCGQRIKFIGFQKNIQDIYSAADYFLFPTVFETFGLVALEAMAAGLIPFANKVYGVEDFIADGENGFICTTVPEYVAALRLVMKDEAAAARITDKALATAQDMNWEHVYRKYRDVFDRRYMAR